MAIWLEKEYALVDRCKLVCDQQRRRVVIIFEILGVASMGVVAVLVVAIGEWRWRSSHTTKAVPTAVPAPRW
jgi:hypothetical protein